MLLDYKLFFALPSEALPADRLVQRREVNSNIVRL